MPLRNKNKILDLIRAICSRVKERNGYLNKTKLIKYLYLIDIEYYRIHKETFTGFNWIFRDYGPWAFEYNEVFREMEKLPDFKIEEGTRPDIDTKFIRVIKDSEIELGEVIKDFEIELKARRIVDRWADENLAPLLNYVYFNTEPMVDAERYRPLDFTKIHNLEPIPKFKLSKSSLDSIQLKKLREKIHAQIEKQKKGIKYEITFTPPKYDEVYFQGIKILDEEDKH